MTTSTNDPTYGLYVGVDIAATFAKVSWLVPGEAANRAITIEQTPQAFSALQLRLLSMGQPAQSILLVMEATGSYWISLATTLTRAGFAVSVINPDKPIILPASLLKQARARCHRCPNPGTSGLPAASDSVDTTTTGLRRTAAAPGPA